MPPDIEISGDYDIAGTPPGVTERGYNRERVLWAPFSSGVVATTVTATVTVTCLVPFRVRRFVLDSAVTASFTIAAVNVGNQPQTAANGAAPGSCFGPTAVLPDLQWDTCQANQPITFSVTNTSGGNLTATGVLIGDALQK